MNMVTVEQCCEILDSMRIPVTASERECGEYPYYGANGIQGYVSNYIFDDELVLVAEDGGNFGSKEKPIAYRVSGKCWVNNHAHVLKPKEGLDVEYLCYSLMFYRVEGMINGATRKKLTQKALRQMKIPMLKLDEQIKIATQIKYIEMIKEKRLKQLQKLDELIQARFVEMFGGLHNSKLYPYVSIETFTDVTSGGTPNRNTKEYWENGNIRWVKTTELHNNFITDTEEYITRKGIDNSSAKVIPAHSILVAMYGQGKTRGMTGYLLKECTTNQACACILPCKRVDQKYLWYYMILSYDKLRGMAKGGNQPNLNIGIIKRFQVLVPPIELQNQFADFVNQVNKSKLVIKNLLQIYKHQIQM